MGRAVMVIAGASRIVGIPKYVDAVENRLEPGTEVIEAIENCVEMFVMPHPIVEGNKQVGVGMMMIGMPCGDIIEYDGAVVIELTNDSPYYVKYAELVSGVVPANTGAEMRVVPPTQKRH